MTKDQVRSLAWQHNIDQEYRKEMSNVDKIRACHALFVEHNNVRSLQLKWQCCHELQLKCDKENRDSLLPHDPMFQIAFRSGEIWDLQDEIFSMWQKFETLGQKKVASPAKKATKSKQPKKVAKSLKKTAGDMNMGHWRALQGMSNPEQMKRLLRRVINHTLSLEQMSFEGEKIKRIVKVKRVFIQVSGQKTWEECREKFPEDTEGLVLASWAEKLAEQVTIVSAF